MTVINIFPQRNTITNVTNSYPAIITLTPVVNYVVDMFVSIRCPAQYGMTQIDGLTGKIVAVNIPGNTISVDIDTTGFDPFVFAPVNQTPQTIPAGEFATLEGAIRNNTARGGYVPV